MSCVLHVHTVLDQELVLDSLKLEDGGILFRNGWIWGAVDSMSVLEPLALLQVISFFGNVFRKSLFGSVIGHRPFSVHTIHAMPPLVAILPRQPNIVSVPGLDIESNSVPSARSLVNNVSSFEHFSIVLHICEIIVVGSINDTFVQGEETESPTTQSENQVEGRFITNFVL